MDLGRGIRNALAKITGAAVVDEKAVKELVRELQRSLLAGDVGVKLVFALSKNIERRCLDEKPLPGFGLREHAVTVVYEELVKILGGAYEPPVGKRRIMLLGLFGSGKTTTASKLARFYKSKGLNVGVVAADVHRPAAHEQLEQLAAQVGVEFYGERGAAAEEIAHDALQKLSHCDVLILDTAGRSAFDGELAAELRRMAEAFKPDDSFLVLSADVGQVAERQAKEFGAAVPIGGVIVTKMDGSGKGGGALSAVAASGSAVAFLGTGEKPDALEAFDPKKFVARLCGFPDLQGLLEKVKETQESEDLEKALEDGKLDYNTFMAQMRAMKKMGPLKNVLQMMGAYDLPEEMLGKSEEKLKQFEAAVNSMTPQERREPELMRNVKRQARVAIGSGMDEKQVRELVSQFDKTGKMMKGMRGNRGLMKKLGKMMPAGFKM